MKTRTRLIHAYFAALLLCLCSSSYAEMMISPTRVFLDQDNRSATMTLRNSSSGPRTYRLSWEDKRATEDGTYNKITEEEEWPSAKQLIRFSPRQITVGPGENQTVRFSFRPPADIDPGEYRSHLLLQVIPDISEPTTTIEQDSDIENVAVQIFLQMSFSIPAVVRYNIDAPQVSVHSVKAVPVNKGEGLGLELTLAHAGDSSSFGDVTVEMQRNSNSPVEQIGIYKELSIFPELDKRKIIIPLRDNGIPKGAVVRIAYEGSKEYKGTLWAEKVFQTE